MNVEIVTITPQMAHDLMRQNKRNRNLSQRRVEQYAHVMKRGEWKITGEPIQFDKTGMLLNGQHRLAACIEAGVPFTTAVVRGVDPDAQMVMDTGARRTFGQQLQIKGEADSNNLAAAVRWVRQYHKLGRITTTTEAQMVTSPAQLLEELEKHPTIRDSVRFATSVTSSAPLGVSRSIISALHYLFAEIDQDASDEFFRRLYSGEALGKTSPIYVMRRWLLNRRMGHQKATGPYMAALIIKSFNYWRQGRRVELITFKPSAGEDYPEILELDDFEVKPADYVKDAQPKVELGDEYADLEAELVPRPSAADPDRVIPRDRLADERRAQTDSQRQRRARQKRMRSEESRKNDQNRKS